MITLRMQDQPRGAIQHRSLVVHGSGAECSAEAQGADSVTGKLTLTVCYSWA